MWSAEPPSASVAAPVRARVPRDSAVVKKKKRRVLDAKTVTQLNSVRVSFMNRKEDEGSLAKAPAARGLRRGPHSCAAAWATPGAACARGRDAEVGRVVVRGPRCEIGFLIFQ